MNERETKNEYKVIQQEGKFAPYVANIERLKSSITPKQNMELKTILVGASKHEGSFKMSALKLLDKKIDQIDSSMSKENMENQEKTNQLATNIKIQRSRSLRPRSLRNKFNGTKRAKQSRMTPIQEGSRESSVSRSKGGKRMTQRSSKSKSKTKSGFLTFLKSFSV